MAITNNTTTNKWEVTSSGTNDQQLLTAGKYLDRDIVVKKIPAGTLTNTIITGESNVKGTASDIDSIDITVTIPAGYYDATTLKKTFDNLLPNFAVDTTAEWILTGKKAYDSTGKTIVGTMTNRGAQSGDLISMTAGAGEASASGSAITLTESSTIPSAGTGYITVTAKGSATASYTIPQGYHNGEGTVTGSVTSNTDTKYYTMNDASISNVCPKVTLSVGGLNATQHKYSVEGTSTATATVNTAGYAAQGKTYTGSVTAKGELNESIVTNLDSVGSGKAGTISKKYFNISEGYYHELRSYTVNDADGLSLAITDKASTDVQVGTEASGYYPLSTSLTGSIAATTPGWFVSKELTDSTVTVGRIAKATFTFNQTAAVGGTTAPKYQIKADNAGYIAQGATAKEITVYNGEVA